MANIYLGGYTHASTPVSYNGCTIRQLAIDLELSRAIQALLPYLASLLDVTPTYSYIRVYRILQIVR